MTPEQEEHLQGLKEKFIDLLDAKYRHGQKEHGGNLWLKPGMIDLLMEEVLDFYVYAMTLKEQIDEVNKAISKNGITITLEEFLRVMSPQNKELDKANANTQ